MNAVIDTENPLPYYLEVFRRRSRKGFIAGGAVLALTMVIALALPSIYRSNAIILIEQQEIPPELVRSTITTFADQRIQVISQRVMTSTNLVEIMNKYDLYEDERQREPVEAVLERMRDDIAMDTISADIVDPRSGRATQATIAFSLAYENQSPALAQKVANELVTLFLNENLRTRAAMAADTASFLTDEAEKLGQRVQELEMQLATFKESNASALPELFNLNMDLRARTESNLNMLEQQIRALQERRMLLQAQLVQVSPYEAVYTETGQRMLGPNDRLKELELTLLEMRSKYGDTHPDVTRVQREIEGLRKERNATSDLDALRESLETAESELTRLEGAYSTDHPDVRAKQREVENLRVQLASARATTARDPVDTPNNPAYLQIATQLATTDTELAAAQRSLGDVQGQLAEFEKHLLQSPQVEREYRALLRDYETSLAKYQDINAKQLEAQVSESLETERKGERFNLIEPPLLPEEPAKPNRLAILLLGLVLAMSTLIGTVVVLESLDDRIYGRRGVLALIGVPPLGFIPHMNDTSETLVRSPIAVPPKMAIGAAGALIVTLLGIHFLYRPLDVLWFILMRKLGL